MVPLLERSGELDVLRAAAAVAGNGAPRFVVIEGPAGIGKTRLLDEFVAESAMRPLRARCDELERDLPHGVLRQLFEPVGEPREILHWLIAHTPVLLAIDDVHLADGPSLRWLLYLARHLADVPVLVVVTRRTGRHQPALTDLVLHPACTVIRPRPLSTAGTARVLAILLGAELPADCVTTCHGLTAGNPLLTRALGLAMSDGATPERPPEPAVRVLADMLRAWLTDLTPDAQAFAQALAVLGDVDDLHLPARLADLDLARAGAACDELWQAGFVSAEPAPRWDRSFVRETVLASLPARRRQQFHAAAARLLAESGPVCDHLLQAPPANDPWVVRTLCAHATQLRGSPDLATTYLERALAEPPPARDRAHVLIALATAESYPRPDTAVAHLTEAIALLDDPAALGGAGRLLSDSLVRAGRPVEAVEVLDRLSSRLGDHEEGVLLRAHRTVLATALAPHLATRADVTGIEGHTVAERATLGAAAFAGALFGATADRTAELALRALPATSSEMANPSVAHTIVALAWTDRLDAAAQRCDVAIDEAYRAGALFTLAALLDTRATIAWLAGELRQARDLAQRSAATMRPEWWGSLRALHHGRTLRVLVDGGDTARAQRLLADLDPVEGDDFPSLFLSGMSAFTRIAAGDLRGGLAAALDCGDRLERAGYENPIPIPWRLWATRACVQLGDLDTARQLATEALAHARHWGTARAVGGALHALGTATRDARLVRSGVEALESSPARLDLVRALIDLGVMQHEHGAHREARETLRRALELAERCGAPHLVTAIRQFLPRTGARRGGRPATGLESLTESERRIAELAAHWPNRRIAEELHLTLRTVETHLSATYRKLGIDGRAELQNLFPENHSPPRTA